MKAARILKPKESLEIEHLETPAPKGAQVLVRIKSAGVCHSDIHLREGGYKGPEGRFLKAIDRGVKYPGHEIAGIIEELGEETAYGFSKNSGFGRELSKFGMLEFVNIKSIRFYDQLTNRHYVE